jgi:trehalose 6-phosphate phosphatase
MKHLLAARNAGVLSRFAGLVALDFDGTLAPIVADRTRARMRARTCTLLSHVAARFPVAVVSGRARADVASRLPGVHVRWVIGNHGLEPEIESPALARYEREMRDVLARVAPLLGGVDIEDKRYSLALHYRGARDAPSAQRAIVAAVAREAPHVRVILGKAVVNVVPAGAESKGDAVARLLRETGVKRALYVGDDDTDEDVFERASESLLCVRVGRDRGSAAPWYVRDQREMDALLRVLVDA